MSEKEEEMLDESCEAETSSLHIKSDECNCPDCQKRKKHYIQILDIDRYINALNDWD